MGLRQGSSSLCLTLALAGLLGGCRVNEGDVKRWETTQRGPFKLVAVITHDKYPIELRTDASMSLISMPSRGGVRQGIKFLIEKYKDEDGEEREGALNQINAEMRGQIVDRVVPLICDQLKAPPPARVENRLPPDPSIPYKDAGFAMFIHDPPLIGSDDTKSKLKACLMTWAQTGFEDRVENGTQQYGLEQMMRALGPESVKALPGLVNENTTRLDRIAGLIKDIGDDPSKLELSKALAGLADKYTTQAWLDAQTKIVKDYNAKNKKPGDADVTDAQVAIQVDKIQERRLTEEVFPAMKRVGGQPSVDWLIKYSADTNKPGDRRKLALAALEGNVDKNNKDQLEKLFNIAKNDANPPDVRDGAFHRIAEFPKEVIVAKMYSLGDSPKWKVREVAFETALLTMNVKQIPDFMNHLPKTAATKMGMDEANRYGIDIRDKVEGDPKDKLATILPYRDSKDLGPKLVALGYFWGGKKADFQKYVAPHENDKDPLPKCDAADECKWECDVPKPGSQETQSQEAKTVGDWVKICLEPSLAK